MLLKTHLAIALCILLIFISHVNSQGIFVVTLVVATLLPEADSGFAILRRKGGPDDSTSRRRGLLHSFTFCILLTIALAFFLPVLALPFFLGYSFHLFADAWTTEGIRPFWPMKVESKGVVRDGGKIEHSIFLVFILIDILLLGINLFR